MVKSINLAENPQYNNQDNLPIKVMDNQDNTYALGIADINEALEISAGRVIGKKVVHKYGRNPDLDVVGVFESLWNGGGLYTGFDATEAQTADVISTDTNDTLTGTGARTIKLYGLDANFLEITETLELNGTTAVTSTKTFIRCDRAKVESAGSGGVNAGTISVAQTTSSIVFASIPIGYNSTMIAAYTVPAGKTGYIDTQFATFSGGKKAAYANVRMSVRLFGSVFTIEGEAALHSEGSSSISRIRKYPVKLPEKTDIHLMADTSEINVAVAGAFDILLEDNTL